MGNFEKLDREIRGKDKRIWKQDEIFDTIWNEKIGKFFENYKKFDQYLVTKNKDALIYSGHISLDAEHSEKLYLDFREAFKNSIKSIVGEDILERMEVFFEENDYLLSNREKMFDSDPFLNDNFQTIILWDNTVAQLSERRNVFNNVEFHYIIYPNRIFRFIDDLCKEHNLKI